MRKPHGIYDDSLALATDLYQLTMAYGYWKNGVAEREATFSLYFRDAPFNSGYTIACGLQSAVDYLSDLRYRDDDLEYLATIPGNDGAPLFEDAFLKYLGELRWSCDVQAIAEGRVVFPNEPLLRVQGPILQAQLVETPLLNIVNFQTLIATKAARVCHAANGESVIEFGMRRAQGLDGAISVARAAYVGGCAGTSNLLAGKLYGIPVMGTHAHSWVMFFDDELAAFRRYADAMPNNCVFLVDTYDTLQGVHHAVAVGRELRERGHEMVGIRLDSGDLAYLSQAARKILDDAGFTDATIVASNSLDEHIIESLHRQGAKIGVWGVGTKLATAADDPALGGVYKLSAMKEGDRWMPRLKLSEQAFKVNNPGVQQVRRYFDGDVYRGDIIYNEATGIRKRAVMVDPSDSTRQTPVDREWAWEELLTPVFERGELVWEAPTLAEIRQTRERDLARFHHSVKRFLNPHEYPVGLEPQLHELKARLMREARERTIRQKEQRA